MKAKETDEERRREVIRIMKKYGEENFSEEMIEECTRIYMSVDEWFEGVDLYLKCGGKLPLEKGE